MASCCQNYVTPTMIRKGEVAVGDHIKLDEDILVSGPAAEAEETVPAAAPMSPSDQQFQAHEESMGGMQTPGSASWNEPRIVRPQDISSLPLIFDEMTDYAHAVNNNGGNTPSYTIPSHPLVPPEYGQTIDYDSAQYMNGFLRTQIGRGVRVQQLIGSGNTVDRYGFLVGVGNNYLLLQDISNGNIMLVDFYTVKYVYIYYSNPVFPDFSQA